MALKAYAKGGCVEVIGEHLYVEDADEVLLYFTAGTTYRMQDTQKETEAIIGKAAKRDFADLLSEHEADYRSLYGRVDFSLGDLSSYDAVPTDQRIEAAKKDRRISDLPSYTLISVGIFSLPAAEKALFRQPAGYLEQGHEPALGL